MLFPIQAVIFIRALFECSCSLPCDHIVFRLSEVWFLQPSAISPGDPWLHRAGATDGKVVQWGYVNSSWNTIGREPPFFGQRIASLCAWWLCRCLLCFYSAWNTLVKLVKGSFISCMIFWFVWCLDIRIFTAFQSCPQGISAEALYLGRIVLDDVTTTWM